MMNAAAEEPVNPFRAEAHPRRPRPQFEPAPPKRRSEEINRRARIYTIRMVIRMVCFALVIIAPGWWKLGFVIAAAILPYIAVIDANQRHAPKLRPIVANTTETIVQVKYAEITSGNKIVDAEIISEADGLEEQ